MQKNTQMLVNHASFLSKILNLKKKIKKKIKTLRMMLPLLGNQTKTEGVNCNFKTQHLVKPKQTDTPMREHAGKIPYSNVRQIHPCLSLFSQPQVLKSLNRAFLEKSVDLHAKLLMFQEKEFSLIQYRLLYFIPYKVKREPLFAL